ncbi:hypothetical protein ESCO_001813 [Escovopsis weberi]|uniref:Uncharacterized protein n=1 Tax=Escovopsis weberi TaxID=150374 RepID=A0A0M8N066_ESCWE|nr:hypothetical protein ESCO_001813 [Escovopsis weberi]
MPPPYDSRGSSRARRGLWGHWVPLAVTVTVATVGLAAWAWSQRRDEQEEAAGFAEHDADLDYGRGDYDGNAPRDTAGEGPGWTSRMNTQQFLDSTGKTIATGIAAASAAVERRAGTCTSTSTSTSTGTGTIISISISSILSHIPRYNDLMLKIFVLIYAPADTPGEKSPILGVSSESTFYNAVYSEALSLVSKETMILPFTTPNGYAYILRHLQPDILYLQESLSGDNGSVITNLHTWLRHDVVLVVGAESGHGGLADSESETERVEKPGRLSKWWQKPERVGRGRGVVVVDSIRVHEDWAHRVQDRE